MMPRVSSWLQRKIALLLTMRVTFAIHHFKGLRSMEDLELLGIIDQSKL